MPDGINPDGINLDTSILIDLQRERRRGTRDGPATVFLRERETVPTYVTVTALAEFAAGFDDPSHPQLVVARRSHVLIPTDADVAMRWAEIARTLRASGELIGANDIWIAAASLSRGLTLASSNIKDFGRVPDLRVVDYRA